MVHGNSNTKHDWSALIFITFISLAMVLDVNQLLLGHHDWWTLLDKLKSASASCQDELGFFKKTISSYIYILCYAL